ncbi:putative chromosome segregation and condensation protein B [Nitrospira japonica]|uniref:Segregation and condensation protein B n=1 Tax=Nitrospira japonica TaxID=1325564 RepID=A0A1W1I6N6_9BACT|nr:SMC-Scp complex subunit ScpB [Nitrospira japonica]SLM48654.1 putative chromosome segregation and condensation protein B [Nitrospira japonica]
MSETELQESGNMERPEAAASEQTGPSTEEAVVAPDAVAAHASDQMELTAILEALLFVSGEPMPLARLATTIGTVSKAEVQQALNNLREQLAHDGRGIQLVQVAGGYRLATKADCAPWLKRLEKAKTAQRLSRSALESLAIIAYKQPLVRAEVEEIRGVETSGVIRTLLERKLVRIVGRKEVPGRPIMYGTTKYFLEHFGLQDLSQLPPLREFKELGEAEQAMLPIEDVTIVGEQQAEPADSESPSESLAESSSDSPSDSMEPAPFQSEEGEMAMVAGSDHTFAGESVDQV